MAEERVEEKKGGKKKVLLILPVFVLLLAGAGAYVFLFKKLDKGKEDKVGLSQVGVMYDLGAFTVNLADTNTDAYARIAITLELSNEKVRQEVDKRLPIIKDTVIDVISSKTSDRVENL